jgi:branched-chain amino acid transport system permease protein
MAEIVETIVIGISIGCLYGLIGLCFTVIYNATDVINFAQGEFLMLGAVWSWLLATVLGISLWIAALIIVGLSLIAAVVFERIVITPLMNMNAGFIRIAICTMGISMIISGATGVLTKFDWLRADPFFGITVWGVGGVSIQPQYVMVVVETLIFLGIYYFFSKSTIYGIALRATGFNKTTVRLLGVAPAAMVFLAFGIAAVMSGLGGMAMAPVTNPNAMMGLPLVIKGFVAAIVGGLGNPYAAVVGGIFVGVLASLVTAYLSSAYAEIAVFAVLIGFLAIRPSGLFGEAK